MDGLLVLFIVLLPDSQVGLISKKILINFLKTKKFLLFRFKFNTDNMQSSQNQENPGVWKHCQSQGKYSHKHQVPSCTPSSKLSYKPVVSLSL